VQQSADFDGDGDLDVLSVAFTSRTYSDSTIAWYENTDGKGTFGNAQVIPVAAGWARSVAAADLDADGDIDFVSASLLVGRIVWHERRLLGDTNADGHFNSSDLVRVFQAGEYEDGIALNSTFAEGDWNGDGEFDSADLVLAFQAGHYETAAQPSRADLAAAVDTLFANDRDYKLPALRSPRHLRLTSEGLD
jgi:hypothetical protein